MKVRKYLQKREAVIMASKDEIQKKYNELMGMSIGALDVDYAGVGRRVKEVRDQRGFTQSQLCDICSCDTTTLSHLENGSASISLSLLYRFSVALGKNIGYFLVDSPLADIAPIIESASDPKWEKCSKQSMDLMNAVYERLMAYQDYMETEIKRRGEARE